VVLTAGARLAERVELVRPLASGAMGEVWVARHLALDVPVAVKLIKAEAWKNDPRARARFEREAKAAARIRSPHVVQILDHGLTEDDLPYIVMELLEGETLGARLRKGRLSPGEVVLIVEQVARALGEAHDQGIIHRDVKPENLFLTRGEPLFVKLLDFGIAKQTTALADGAATQTGVVVGTPQYMSPEQLLRAAEPDATADLWALTVVAYEALVGRPAFHGETVASLIVAISHARYARPGAVVPALSAIDAWFERAFDLEPRVRPATAAELARTFAVAVRALDDAAPPSSRPPASSTSAAADTAAFLAERGLEDVETGESSRDVVEPGDSSEPVRPPEVPMVSSEPPEPVPSVRVPSEPLLPEPLEEGSSTTAGLSTVGEAPRATARSRSPRRWALGAAAALVVVAIGAAAASFRGDAPAGASTTASPSSTGASEGIEAPRAVASTIAASEPDDGALVQVEPIRVKAGPAGRYWLDSFAAVSRGSGSATLFEATEICRARAEALCTEIQWEAACAADASVAGLESWTATASGERFVVRGGGRCAARAERPANDRSPRRGALCCERAIAFASSNANPAFRSVTTRKLMAYETAIDAEDPAGLREIFAESVEAWGRWASRDQLIATVRSQLAGVTPHWELHDRCDVSVGERGGEPIWSADCMVLVRRAADYGHVKRRYVYGGADARLVTIGEAEVFRPLAPPR
jgi:eukaryotic-like serine/threonine-protein kinase